MENSNKDYISLELPSSSKNISSCESTNENFTGRKTTAYHKRFKLMQYDSSVKNSRLKKMMRKNNSERKPNDETKPKRQTNKPPAHLKGREIGLWYKEQSLRRKIDDPEKEKKLQYLADVYVSEEKVSIIKRNLGTISTSGKNKKRTNDEIEHSNFKLSFLKVIYGNLDSKLNLAGNIERDVNIDIKLKRDFLKKQEINKYKEMQICRKKLPSYDMQEEVVEMIENNQITIISGETGCGKTTQVAQFILDRYLENEKGSLCKIVCTQPRRISAISVAERVAEERCEQLGESVGFHIRLEQKFPRSKGSILYCTTGIILKQMEDDVSLKNVSHLILDEIHERDVLSDFLIAIMSKVIKYRSDLKVILMSATLNAKKFAEYFNVESILHIPGFTFEVKINYLEDILLNTGYKFVSNRIASDEYMKNISPYIKEWENKYPKSVVKELLKESCDFPDNDLIVKVVKYICEKEKDEGAILIFLPGIAEIKSLNEALKSSGSFPNHKYSIIPLHSQLPTTEQKFIFKPAPPGMRKIILSTNIAETSVTIDDVTFVIDVGKIKISNFEVETNQQTLNAQWVSMANADQRKGRAGRVKPGICYRLYTKARMNSFEKYQKPEILRKRLEDVVLQVKILQLGNAEMFLNTLMDPPNEDALKLSINLLKQLEALDDDEFLTPLGFHLARLPLQPQIGKMILLSAIFSCLDPILTIAAFLDFKDPFHLPMGNEENLRRKRYQLGGDFQSDHIMIYEAMKIFESTYNKNQFCWEYFLSYSTMKMIQDLKQQFAQYLYDLNFLPNADPKNTDANLHSSNYDLVRAILAAGLFPNIAYYTKTFKTPRPDRMSFRTLEYNTVKLHPKSVLYSTSYLETPVLLAFYLKIKNRFDSMHDASVVHPRPLILFGNKFKMNISGDRAKITINERLNFTCSKSAAELMQDLRLRMINFLDYKVSHPGFVNWKNNGDEVITMLGAIIHLIMEDE